MSSVRWIAVILGAMSLPVLAEPLRVEAATFGKVTALTGRFGYFSGAEPGSPVVVNFEKEFSPSFEMVDGNTFTFPRESYFDKFEITAGGSTVRPSPPYYTAPAFLTTIQLQNDVRNAAGELVDVFELTVGASLGTTLHYTTITHLEYAATTFGELDPWSILAVKDAPLLRGTFHLHELSEGWDATFRTGDMDVEVNRFDIQFSGPGTEVPAVPEPSHGAMLLAGLAGVAVLRRRSSAP